MININSINVDVLPTREVRSTSTKLSSTDRSWKRKNHERTFHRIMNNLETDFQHVNVRILIFKCNLKDLFFK